MPQGRRLRRRGEAARRRPLELARPGLVPGRRQRTPETTLQAPFKRRLSSRLLREEPKPLIEADAELVDGRILTLAERVRICR